MKCLDLRKNHTIHNSWLSLMIFLVVFLTHFFSQITPLCDSRWSVYTTMSIMREGNTDLDEYSEIIKKHKNYMIEKIDDHIYTVYPIGTSAISIPLVFIVEKFANRSLGIPLDKLVYLGIPYGIETFVASIIIALSSVLIFHIAFLLLGNRKHAILIVFIFAFCTSSWSTATRALWQHGPSILLLSFSLYLILLAKGRPWIVQFVSIPLAFSYVVRPTNSISILMFTIFILILYRKYFFYYCLWSLIVFVPFIIFNLNVYHSVLSPYYSPNVLVTNPHFFEALAGNLVSPGRGLFLFSPVFLFAVCGIFFKIRDKQINMLDYFLIAIICMHLIVISSFSCWWAGHSFGPRFLSDMIPYLVYFLVPVVEKIPTIRGVKKIGLVSIFLLSVAVSFFIHFRGANRLEVHVWNAEPINVDSKPARVWDWGDIQFLRGIRK